MGARKLNVVARQKALFVSDANQYSAGLKKNLPDCDVALVDDLAVEGSILDSLLHNDVDLMIVAVSRLNDGLLKRLLVIIEMNPIPIVVFAQEDNPEQSLLLTKTGLCTYLAGETSMERLPSILRSAWSRFQTVNELQNELAQIKKQLSDRKWIDKAKGLLMQSKGMSEEEAYAYLRKTAMNQNKSIGEIAKSVIALFDLIN